MNSEEVVMSTCSHVWLRRGTLASALVAALVTQGSPASAQAPSGAPPRSGAPRASAARTAWGDPDLQGIWTNDGANMTPTERPKQHADRATLTEEEVAQKAEEQKKRLSGPQWYEVTPQKPIAQTSLVVDPPDGRIPPFTPEARKRVEAMMAERDARGGVPESAAQMGLWTRCISRTLPGAWLPRVYNNNRQILQAPGYVVILYEEIHEARVIPLDRRPPPSSAIRTWMGYSRGHWENGTLVVEATNFRENANYRGTPFDWDDIPVGPNYRIVERFTRADANTINYEATITDPDTFTRPWTIRFPMMKDTTQTQILEYSCHEGNRSMIPMLGGARALEKEAAQKGIKAVIPRAQDPLNPQ